MIKLGKCVVDQDGAIVELVREPSWQGMVFKDEEAFLNKPNEPCYVPENHDCIYTRVSFLCVAEGDESIAEEMFYGVDWETPETYLDCNLRDGEFVRCERCGKLILARMKEVKVCPHCGEDPNKEY